MKNFTNKTKTKIIIKYKTSKLKNAIYCNCYQKKKKKIVIIFMMKKNIYINNIYY